MCVARSAGHLGWHLCLCLSLFLHGVLNVADAVGLSWLVDKLVNTVEKAVELITNLVGDVRPHTEEEQGK